MELTSDWCGATFGPRLRAILSDLHQHPELSMEEHRTTARIREVLAETAVEIVDVGAETGVVARLAGGEGPAVGLRADIDAITQQERADRPDRSLTDGKMHGCGHDIHTTGLLGAAMALSRCRDQLRGDVYFIFQPAEESLSGARYLVDRCGLWDKLHLDAIFGLHNYPELPVGTVGIRPGPLMSYKDGFSLRLVGRSGHSSMPQKNIDPIVAAAALIQSLQTIASRNVGPLDAAVISVCQLHAGNAAGLVVDDAALSGNIRTLDPDVRARVLQRFRQIAEGTAAAYECGLELDLHPIVPGVCNDGALLPAAQAAAVAALGEGSVRTPPVNLASEDFSIYGLTVPSFFYFLGSGAPERPLYSWHNACFHPDERTPIYGAALLAQSVLAAQRQLSGDTP